MSKTKRSLHRAGWFLLAFLICACGQSSTAPTQTTRPSAIFTLTPITFSNTATPAVVAPTIPSTAKPRDQVYTDPMGWYSVTLPAEWKPESTLGTYSGENGFFKTEYLPEMKLMRNSMDVCQWLANISSKATYSVAISEKPGVCRLTSLPGISPASMEEIYQNPAANNAQRFLSIQADAQHFDGISSSFIWLHAIDQEPQGTVQPEPLRPEDASFWKNTVPLPAGFSIKEYKLLDKGQGADPSQTTFDYFIPKGAPLEEWGQSKDLAPVTWDSTNMEIKPFGYEFRPSSKANLYQLYKSGSLLIDNVADSPTIYHFSTPGGERIASLVYSIKDGILPLSDSPNNIVRYLVQNDTLTQWQDDQGYLSEPEAPPIFLKDELLWVWASDRVPSQPSLVEVQNSQGKVLYTFASYYGARLPINSFVAWNGHWILEISDFIIQDGIILNEKFGFEEAFDWRLFNNKPFYFFSKGQRAGIFYDGAFHPLNYQEVIHGYCCGLTINNPSNTETNVIRFFAKRDGIWYYVIAEAH